MLHDLFYNITHLPMVWNFIIPLSVTAVFCVILMWEGEYGHAVKKHFKIRFNKMHQPGMKA